jgi:hypothetical protein
LVNDAVKRALPKDVPQPAGLKANKDEKAAAPAEKAENTESAESGEKGE